MIGVELDIFSGVPNPRWVLSDQEEAQLIDQLIQDPSLILPDTLGPAVGTGYNGFYLRILKANSPALQKAVRANIEIPVFFRLAAPAQAVFGAKWVRAAAAKRMGMTDAPALEAVEKATALADPSSPSQGLGH